MKKYSNETISRYNNKFHIAYRRMELPFIVMLPAAIQNYLDSVNYLTEIFLRQLPPTDIDTLDKVFQEVVTFMKQENPNGGVNMIIPLIMSIIGVLPPYQEVLWVAIPHYQPQPSILAPQHVVAPPTNIIYPSYKPSKVAFFEQQKDAL